MPKTTQGAQFSWNINKKAICYACYQSKSIYSMYPTSMSSCTCTCSILYNTLHVYWCLYPHPSPRPYQSSLHSQDTKSPTSIANEPFDYQWILHIVNKVRITARYLVSLTFCGPLLSFYKRVLITSVWNLMEEIDCKAFERVMILILRLDLKWNHYINCWFKKAPTLLNIWQGKETNDIPNEIWMSFEPFLKKLKCIQMSLTLSLLNYGKIN